MATSGSGIRLSLNVSATLLLVPWPQGGRDPEDDAGTRTVPGPDETDGGKVLERRPD